MNCHLKFGFDCPPGGGSALGGDIGNWEFEIYTYYTPM